MQNEVLPSTRDQSDPKQRKRVMTGDSVTSLQRWLYFIIAGILVFGIVCGLVGYAIGKNQAYTSAEAPSVSSTMPSAPTQPSDDSQQREAQALAYLHSSTRVGRFNQAVPTAGILIAKALVAGRFGPVDRYDADKKPLQPGYVGDGGIMAKDRTAFAWVYWKADGSIDYTKPITQISIRNDNAVPATEVSMFGPQGDPATDTDSSYWKVYKAIGTRTEVTATLNIISPAPSSTKENSKFYYPYSLRELRDLDDQGFDQLEANMTSLFGPNWDR
jgi:hypothetical protein